jgi:hypothetical protein
MLQIAVNNTKTPDDEIRLLANYLRNKWEEKGLHQDLLEHQLEKYSELRKSAKTIEGRSFARQQVHLLKKSNSNE